MSSVTRWSDKGTYSKTASEIFSHLDFLARTGKRAPLIEVTITMKIDAILRPRRLSPPPPPEHSAASSRLNMADIANCVLWGMRDRE